MSNTTNLPKKAESCLSLIYAICGYFVVGCIILFFFLSEYGEKKLYNDAQTRHSVQMSNYNQELDDYCKELFRYLYAIDKAQPITKSGSIPVKVSVSVSRGIGSQTIGNEFSYNYYINGERVSKYNYVSLVEKTEILTEIRENDPSSDDVGKQKTTLTLDYLELNDGITIHQTVRVRESYGINAGNEAVFDVAYTIVPQKVLRLTSKQKEGLPQRPIEPEKPQRADYRLGFIDTVKHYSVLGYSLCSVFLGVIIAVLIRHKTLVNKYKNAREELLKQLSEKSVQEICGFPDQVLISDDGLPYTKTGSGKYGKFTVFVTTLNYTHNNIPYSYTDYYHRKNNPCFHADISCLKTEQITELHMFDTTLQRYKPCSKCASNISLEKPDWYIKYLDLEKTCKYFDIKMSR